MLSQLADMLDVTSLIIFLLVFFLVYNWFTAPKNLPPGPIRLPVVGSMLSLATAGSRDILEILRKWHRSYGDVFTLQLGNTRFVVLNSREAIQETFVKKGDIFSGRPSGLYVWKKVIETIGTGIILNEGPVWKEMRRVTLMTMREFGVGKKTLEERVREEARAVMDVLDKGQGQEICLKPLFSKFTSNVICSIIFGSRFEYDNTLFLELTSIMDEIVKQNVFFAPINFFPFLRLFPFTHTAINRMISISFKLDHYLDTLIKQHEVTYNPEEIRDFVDLFIKTSKESEDKHLYTARNMQRAIGDLFATGTETSSTTLTWLILYMVQFPHIQSRCQEDIDNVTGHTRMVEVNDRQQLPYVEAVICETMRLVPVAPLGLPHVAVQEGTISGYTIPTETIILANLWAVHRDQKVWSNPLAFKPERFLDKEGHFCPPKDHSIPFSIGSRICLGEALARMELFVLFTNLLQFYTFSMANGHKPDLKGHFGVAYTARDQSVLATRR